LLCSSFMQSFFVFELFLHLGMYALWCWTSKCRSFLLLLCFYFLMQSFLSFDVELVIVDTFCYVLPLCKVFVLFFYAFGWVCFVRCSMSKCSSFLMKYTITLYTTLTHRHR
jgi:hypothetical protein